MNDWACYPVWVKHLPDEIFENIPIEDIELSLDTRARIKAWDDTFQDTYNPDVPQDSGFNTEAEIDQFESEGRKIWQIVIDELKSKYTVSYYSYKQNILLFPPVV